MIQRLLAGGLSVTAFNRSSQLDVAASLGLTLPLSERVF